MQDFNRPARLLLLVIVAILGGSACNAQGLPAPALFSAIQTCIATQSPVVGCDVESSLQEATDSSLLALNTTFAPSTAQVRMHVNNVAEAGYGFMRASAEDTYRIGNVPLFTNSYSIAVFLDNITASSPALNGQTGYMIVHYALNGNVNSSAGTAAEGIFSCYIQALGVYHNWEVLDTSGAVNGLFTAPDVIQFTYGQPFTLDCLLLGDASTYNAQEEYATVTGKGSAIANFANTALISGFEFTDANGNPMAGTPTLTSSSGTQYFSTGVLTPFRKLDIEELEVEKQGKEIQLEGAFVLARNWPGFDPLTDDVAFQVGTDSRVIPAGSFRAAGKNQYGFNGAINGLTVRALIKRQTENHFSFELKILGSSLGVTAGSQNVTIHAGMNGGTATALVPTE
jgi:hypothetical protein